MKNKYTIGAIAMMAGAFLYASLSIGIRYLYSQGIPESSVTPLFTFVVALSATIWSAMFHRTDLSVPKSQRSALVFQGLVGVAAVNFLYYKALELLPASVAITLLFLNPVFIFIFHWIADRNRPSAGRFIALFLVVLGLASISGLVFSSESIHAVPLKGILLAIGASVCYGAMQLNVEKRLGGLKPAVIAMYSSSVAALALFILYGPATIFSFDITTKAIASIAMLGVLTGLAPILLIYFALNKIGAFATSMIGTVELPITALLGYIFLGETMNQPQWIGMVFILIGVMMVQMSEMEAA